MVALDLCIAWFQNSPGIYIKNLTLPCSREQLIYDGFSTSFNHRLNSTADKFCNKSFSVKRWHSGQCLNVNLKEKNVEEFNKLFLSYQDYQGYTRSYINIMHTRLESLVVLIVVWLYYIRYSRHYCNTEHRI